MNKILLLIFLMLILIISSAGCTSSNNNSMNTSQAFPNNTPSFSISDYKLKNNEVSMSPEFLDPSTQSKAPASYSIPGTGQTVVGQCYPCYYYWVINRMEETKISND